jgi:hypothetical protein
MSKIIYLSECSAPNSCNYKTYVSALPAGKYESYCPNCNGEMSYPRPLFEKYVTEEDDNDETNYVEED